MLLIGVNLGHRPISLNCYVSNIFLLIQTFTMALLGAIVETFNYADCAEFWDQP